MLRSHVEVVALHLHSAEQPCLNFTVIPFGKPRGGIELVPVINLNNFASTSWSTSRKRT